jgi:hypothetical protein
MDAIQAGTEAAAPAVDLEAVEKKVRSSASWFLWIAALSLVNTAMAFSGGDRQFLFGLAVTQFVDDIANMAIADGGPAVIRWVAIGFDLLVAGLLVGAGVLARKRPWAFLTGIVLYVLDAVLCLLFQAWAEAGFHALALVFLVTGYLAARRLKAATAPAPAAAAANPLVR